MEYTKETQYFDLKEIKEKIKEISKIDDPVKILIFKRKSKRIKEIRKNLGKIPWDTILKLADEFCQKYGGREIIQEFLEHCSKKGWKIEKRRPKYVNISFQATPEELKKVSEYLKKNNISFREFVIRHLENAFKIKSSKFFIKRGEEVTSPQILLPEDFFSKVKEKFKSKKTARKKISLEIKNAISKIK